MDSVQSFDKTKSRVLARGNFTLRKVVFELERDTLTTKDFGLARTKFTAGFE